MARPARYDFKTQPVAHPDAIVAGDKYRFSILTDGLLRFEWAEDGRFEDRASTFAVNRKLAIPDFYVWDRGTGIEIVTKRFHVVYDKQKFSADGFKIHLKGAVTGTWTYGQQTSNLGGTTRTLDGVDGRTSVGPGVLSRDGIAILDDSKSMLFENDGWIAGRRTGDRTDEYVFMYGRDYREAIRAYYALSGSQPLLPRYAMGNWWSRYHAYDEKEYLELHDHFDRDNVPMNVAVVDMDWHLVWNLPDGINGWTGYTWNKSLFQDPDAFIKKLHDRGMKLTLNLHPADGIRHHEDQYSEVARYMGVDPATKQAINFDCTDRTFMDAYFDIVHHQHEERGVNFWWVDWQQGNQSKIPGVDPLWVLNHFHFLDSGRGTQRPLILSRFGGPGAQRYQIGFSGDAIITWESLNFQPEFTATASNIGYGWWSNDIGGHTHGYKNDELTTRWVHLGCFSPILRLHSDNNPFNSREPWRYNNEARDIIEDTLRFRHRLVPYLYTMNARAAADDEPLIQPMYWDYPEADDAYTVPNQFKFGSELIVVPITKPRDIYTHLGATKAWLPPGKKFVDIFTGIVYSRTGALQLHRPLTQTPVLAPEGAIIPLDGAWRPASGSPNPDTFEIVLVVGADGSFTLIEDDGTGSHVDDGGFHMLDAAGADVASEDQTVRFCYTPITYKQATGTLTIGPASRPDVVPKTRSWAVRLVSYAPADGAEIGALSVAPGAKRHAKSLGVKVETCDLSASATSPTPSTSRSNTTNPPPSSLAPSTILTFPPIPPTHTLILSLPPTPTLAVLDPNPRIWKILDDANAYVDHKWDVWNTVSGEGDVLGKVRALRAKGMQSELLDAVVEGLEADVRYSGGGEVEGQDGM